MSTGAIGPNENFNCYDSQLGQELDQWYLDRETEVNEFAGRFERFDQEFERRLTFEDKIFDWVQAAEGDGEEKTKVIESVLRLLTDASETSDVAVVHEVLNRIRLLPKVKLSKPRVFISHRSVDAKYALALGSIVGSKGLSYWIDVLDPSLALIVKWPNSVQKSIATALVVEIALLNCSHVLAVLTASTAGSWWLPYEYGRIRERPINSSNAAAWFHSSFISSLPSSSRGFIVIPEYLYLGGQLRSRPEIDQWLDQEIKKWP